MQKFTGVKVFSATMLRERETLGEQITAWLGEQITAWLRANPRVEVVDKVVTQSSDDRFHCIAITLFYELRRPVARRTAASAFNVQYAQQTLSGEPGWSYEIYADGRWVGGGWSRGRRKEAELEASKAVASLMAKAA
jgi:hypothetical protein